MCRLFSVALVLLWLITPLAFAQLSGTTSQPLLDGGQSWLLPVQILVFIISLTSIPAILLVMTSFTRIIIVFGLSRNALGTPFAPLNRVLLGLALSLASFIISPMIDKIYVDVYQPFSGEKVSMQEALGKGAQSLREFMLHQTREIDLGLSARLANIGPLQKPEAVPMRILLPVYATSELETAFQIGFTVFIPFLIIDLVIASVLMVSGMMMVPPATIALPFKLMLFILVDGWQLPVGSPAQSFYGQRGKMTPESVMMMGTEVTKVALALAVPLLLVALIADPIISILQAVTQINEATLSFIPKTIAVFIVTIIAGSWIFNLLLDYVRTLLTNLPYIIGQPVQ